MTSESPVGHHIVFTTITETMGKDSVRILEYLPAKKTTSSILSTYLLSSHSSLIHSSNFPSSTLRQHNWHKTPYIGFLFVFLCCRIHKHWFVQFIALLINVECSTSTSTNIRAEQSSIQDRTSSVKYPALGC
jgi:hypothetical protein